MIHNNPPFDGGAERLCLGAMLILPESAPYWETIVRPDDFFVPKHRAIARAVYDLRSKGLIHDAVALANYFVAQSNGTSQDIAVTSSELMALTEEALGEGLLDNLSKHAERVRILSVVREMRSLAQLIAVEAATITQDAEAWLDSVTQRVMHITQRSPRAERPADVASLTRETVTRLMSGGKPSGVMLPEKFGNLRRLWTRLQPKLYFIAARPGVGKTSLLYEMSHEIAATGAGICVNLSWEMEEDELILRELARRVGRSVDEIDIGPDGAASRFSKEVQDAGIRMQTDIPATIDFCPGLPVEQIKARVRRRLWEAQRVYGDLPLVLVTADYLQLIRPQVDRGNTNSNLEHITRELALASGELKVPFVVGCQLNRESDKKGERPSLKDLRGSGAIEQDAHGVIFLHRETEEGETEIIIGKQRRGPKGLGFLNFIGRTTSFMPSRKEPMSLNGVPIRDTAPAPADDYSDYDWSTP